MAIHCAYGLCNSDSRYRHKDYMKGVEFVPFPKPHENLANCQRWVNACGRAAFSYSQVTKDTYICTKHFVGEKGPTKENPHPIPLLLVGDHAYTHKIRKDPFLSHKACSVPNCLGRPTKNISLHRFPKNPLYLEKWISAFKMTSVPKNAFACCQHFEKSNYHYTTPTTRRKRLKLNAIPTLNLPDSSDIQNDSCNNKNSVLDDAKKKIKAILQSLDNDEIANESIAEEIADKILMNAIKSGTKPVDAQTIKSIITNGKSIGSLCSKKRISKTSKRGRPSKKKLESPQIQNLGAGRDEEANGNLELVSVKCEPPDIYDEVDLFPIKEEPVPETFLDPPFADNINDTEVTFKEEPLFDWEEPTRPTLLFNGERIHVADFIDCIKGPKQKECAVCFKKVARKEVCTFCPDCPGNPPLCLKSCFKIHHGY